MAAPGGFAAKNIAGRQGVSESLSFRHVVGTSGQYEIVRKSQMVN
jgi:hypothetical protein